MIGEKIAAHSGRLVSGDQHRLVASGAELRNIYHKITFAPSTPASFCSENSHHILIPTFERIANAIMSWAGKLSLGRRHRVNWLIHFITGLKKNINRATTQVMMKAGITPQFRKNYNSTDRDL